MLTEFHFVSPFCSLPCPPGCPGEVLALMPIFFFFFCSRHSRRNNSHYNLCAFFSLLLKENEQTVTWMRPAAMGEKILAMSNIGWGCGFASAREMKTQARSKTRIAWGKKGVEAALWQVWYRVGGHAGRERLEGFAKVAGCIYTRGKCQMLGRGVECHGPTRWGTSHDISNLPLFQEAWQSLEKVWAAIK